MALVANRQMKSGRSRSRIAPLLLATAVLLTPVSLATAQEPATAPQGPTSLLPDLEPETVAPAPSAGAPKSLLPDDLALPPPPPVATPAPIVPAAPVATAPPVIETATPAAEPEEPEDPLAELEGPTELPEHAGLLTTRTTGYEANLFTGSDARFLATLLRRIDGPLASRWAQIMVQRALLTRAAPPDGLNPGDWVSARSMALIAMGSASDAHRMIERIAIDRYTQSLYAAAAEAALASADPIALCPLSTTARALTELPAWTMAEGMCAAVFGDDYGSAVLFDRVRAGNAVKSFDIGLAERIASAAGTGQRGAHPEWEEISQLTSWRIGLAIAAGLEIPQDRLDTATPAQRAWIARLAGAPLAQRATLAPDAAALGVLGSAEVNRVMAAHVLTLAPNVAANSAGGLLRRANAADSMAERLDALSDLWTQAPPGSLTHYGWLVASAMPASRIPASAATAGHAPQLAEALVSAGITSAAGRWWNAAADESAATRARLWAALVAVNNDVPATTGLYDAWAATVPAHRARLLAAGLAGLGRGEVAPAHPALDNAWTRALDRAVAARHAGEVMILTATGLQGGWGDVHPDYLRRIAAALVAVGRTGEARMIVAEAAIRG